MFTEVGKKHSIPAFLFHPLVFVSPKTNFDQEHDQGDGCGLFCGNQYIIFGVINSEWQKGQSHSLPVLIVSSSVKEHLRPNEFIYMYVHVGVRLGMFHNDKKYQ